MKYIVNSISPTMSNEAVSNNNPAIAIVDCGAESGRVVLARPWAEEPSEQFQVIHRFATKHYACNGNLHWDWDHHCQSIDRGIQQAAQQAEILAIGIDTWGVDFGLLDHHGDLISDPRCYRDPRGERGGILLDQHPVPLRTLSTHWYRPVVI